MKHRDFVIYVRNSVEINALVALSQDVFTPATQTEPAFTTEHLTLVYLDPASEAQRMTGDQLRASIKTVFDVAPLVEGAVNGWKEVPNAIDPVTGLPLRIFPGLVGGQPGDPDAEILAVGTGPTHETKTYSDGTVATGIAPLPDLSPAQQDAAEEEEAIEAKAFVAAADRIRSQVILRESLDPAYEAEAAKRTQAIEAGLGSSVEGQPLSGGIVPAEEVVQTDPAIAEATANPTE